MKQCHCSKLEEGPAQPEKRNGRNSILKLAHVLIDCLNNTTLSWWYEFDD